MNLLYQVHLKEYLLHTPAHRYASCGGIPWIKRFSSPPADLIRQDPIHCLAHDISAPPLSELLFGGECEAKFDQTPVAKWIARFDAKSGGHPIHHFQRVRQHSQIQVVIMLTATIPCRYGPWRAGVPQFVFQTHLPGKLRRKVGRWAARSNRTTAQLAPGVFNFSGDKRFDRPVHYEGRCRDRKSAIQFARILDQLQPLPMPRHAGQLGGTEGVEDAR